MNTVITRGQCAVPSSVVSSPECNSYSVHTLFPNPDA